MKVAQKSGLKLCATDEQDTAIQSMVIPCPSESVDQITSRLSKKAIQVSKTLLRRRFKEAEVQSMRSTSKPLLTSDHTKKRDLNGLLKDVNWN